MRCVYIDREWLAFQERVAPFLGKTEDKNLQANCHNLTPLGDEVMYMFIAQNFIPDYTVCNIRESCGRPILRSALHRAWLREKNAILLPGCKNSYFFCTVTDLG